MIKTETPTVAPTPIICRDQCKRPQSGVCLGMLWRCAVIAKN